jgi:dGTPase
MAEALTDLAPYAANEGNSQGRRHKEAPPTHRGEYERDRDRVIHSTAFRRLVYKTQVFVNHEGDLYRTRLTHSLEVAQIARTIAGALGINEPLVEAISLAHDLGHTPFGHAGQDALNTCMRDFGGFEHNLQSLRVVDELEERYPEFLGLNLTFETREGILKHCSSKNARQLGDVGKRFLDRTQAGLEAQLVNLADAIAYNNHDVDDGFRAGLISIEQLREQTLFGDHCDDVQNRYPDLDDRRVIYEVIRRMIGYLVDDLVTTSVAEIHTHMPDTIDAVRSAPHAMIHFSDAVLEQHSSFKKFLRDNLYRHDQVRAMNEDTQDIVEVLFARYMSDPIALPESFAARASSGGEDVQARVVADYIAGMTDRFAIAEHERLTA